MRASLAEPIVARQAAVYQDPDSSTLACRKTPYPATAATCSRPPDNPAGSGWTGISTTWAASIADRVMSSVRELFQHSAGRTINQHDFVIGSAEDAGNVFV